jgi:hypothetical protein
MRQHYSPIFRSVLNTRLWSKPASWRCVWLWCTLAADPEGMVPSDIHGVSIGANVTLSEAREAMAFLESPDEDADPEDPHQGRVLQRIRGGWLVIGHEVTRQLARHEATKAYNRRYMAAKRAAQGDGARPVDNDTSHALPVKTPIPKPKPKPKTDPSEGISPQPPAVDISRFEGDGFDRPVIRRFPDGWVPDPALRAAAITAGVTKLDEHIARLKTGPIGGSRGVFAADFEDYIRSMFGKWRTWEETDRAKAADAIRKPWQPAPEPEPKPLPHVPGFPKWVLESHQVAATLHGLDLKTEARVFAKDHHIPPKLLKVNDAALAFTHYLLRRSNTEAA